MVFCQHSLLRVGLCNLSFCPFFLDVQIHIPLSTKQFLKKKRNTLTSLAAWITLLMIIAQDRALSQWVTCSFLCYHVTHYGQLYKAFLSCCFSKHLLTLLANEKKQKQTQAISKKIQFWCCSFRSAVDLHSSCWRCDRESAITTRFYSSSSPALARVASEKFQLVPSLESSLHFTELQSSCNRTNQKG